MLDKIINKLTPKKTFYFKSDKYNSFEMFREMLSGLNNLAKVIGSDAFSINYTPANPAFVLMITYFLSIIIENIYWIYYYRDDATQLIFCIISVPSLGQSLMKIYSFIIHRSKLYEIFSFVEKFHETYYEASTKKVMEECVLRSCHLCLVLALLLISGGFLIIIYPGIIYLFTGHKVLHFGFKLLFIDAEKLLGYTLNFLNNTICLTLFLISTILTCIDIAICVLNIFGLYNVLKIYLDELDELAKSNETGKNDREIRMKIKQIIDLHNFLLECDAINFVLIFLVKMI